ncbi:Malonate--CoA ligase [Vitis vinifera]|uniref:Malonate--CoA ligase n=1 Tax=Vitis vinifera TaxID=29760 RepID=A0A438CRG5_VITVI|nr:Malonate--CoA ligase [Vitis vinifera]
MGVNKTADDVETLGIPVGSAPLNSTAIAEMGRIEASELSGGQPMAQPVGMSPVIQQPQLPSIQGGFYQDHATSGMVENFVNGRPWTTGLFDCHEHKTNGFSPKSYPLTTAKLVFFRTGEELSCYDNIFPCVTFGQIAEVVDEGEMTCPLGSFIYLLMMPALCSQWIMGSKYRAKLRRKYDLVEAPHQDIVSHIFCPCCSLCQEFRELKIRGLDPALGWKGILAQRQRGQNQDQELKVPPNQAMFKGKSRGREEKRSSTTCTESKPQTPLILTDFRNTTYPRMPPFNKVFNHFIPIYLRHPCLHSPSLPLRFSALRFLSVDAGLLAARYSTFMEVIKAVARQGSATAESVAIRANQKSYSYNQLISSARKISSLLCNGDIKPTYGVSKHKHSGNGHLGGARIGIVAKPSVEFVAGILGTWFSGGVAVPLALSYPEAELLHVMNDSDVSMILSTEDYRELMENVAAKSSAQFSLIPPVPSIPSPTSARDYPQTGEIVADKSLQGEIGKWNKLEDEDPALIIYTSGTTGKPKGVVHTHKSINSQVEFMPKFSVRGIWQRWRESHPKDGTEVDDAITVFTGVPTMYTRLIQGYEAMDPELQAASASAASKLRLMMCGSSALPYPVMQQWETITGHRLLERYGMTEFVMAISNPLKGVRKGGTVGKPLPGVQVKILADESDPETTGLVSFASKALHYLKNIGNFLSYTMTSHPKLFERLDSEQKMRLRRLQHLCYPIPLIEWTSSTIFDFYLDHMSDTSRKAVTKESFIDGGFFKTGDAVKVDDDGYYIILGRTSADIMKVGGYKLSALEIEAALLEANKDYGEAVCAIIVPEADEKKKQEEELKPAISLEELCTWAKEKLAPYKLPTQLLLWDSLPRNAMGKVNKKELKRKLAAEGH